MTQSTEQERPTRQDFEQWAIRTNQGYDLTLNQSGRMQTYEHDKTEHAWRGFFHGMQAIRRAPAVPGHTLKLIKQALECAVERLAQAQTKPNLVSTLEWNALQEIRNALAAAPQQPEAKTVSCACGDEFAADSYGAGFLDAKGKCFACDAETQAEPVKLPSPIGVLRVFEPHEDAGVVCTEATVNAGHLPHGWHRLYTENQVRQILSTLQK